MASSYTLGSHFEGFIKDMVESGRYASASEVMRDGLRLMEEREKLRTTRLEALRAEIHDGLSSGPAEPFDIAELKTAARNRRSQGKGADG